MRCGSHPEPLVVDWVLEDAGLDLDSKILMSMRKACV